MRPLTDPCGRCMRSALRGTSLLETVVAAVLFLTVFAATMELLPRLTLRGDDSLLVAEARYRLECAYGKYASDRWPCGTYAEPYDGGVVEVRIEPYRDFADVRLLTCEACIPGRREPLTLQILFACDED